MPEDILSHASRCFVRVVTSGPGIVFLLYLACIPIFALLYYALYRRSRYHFFFQDDILASRRWAAKSAADGQIEWLRVLVPVFARAVNEQLAGTARLEGEGLDEWTMQLSDGSAIAARRTVVQGPKGDELQTYSAVTVRGVDGSSVTRPEVGYFEPSSETFRRVLRDLEHRLAVAHKELADLSRRQPRVWRYVDFVYFSTVTQSTVGYGDILPNSTAVRTVVMTQILLGYALLVVVLNLVIGALTPSNRERGGERSVLGTRALIHSERKTPDATFVKWVRADPKGSTWASRGSDQGGRRGGRRRAGQSRGWEAESRAESAGPTRHAGVEGLSPFCPSSPSDPADSSVSGAPQVPCFQRPNRLSRPGWSPLLVSNPT